MHAYTLKSQQAQRVLIWLFWLLGWPNERTDGHFDVFPTVYKLISPYSPGLLLLFILLNIFFLCWCCYFILFSFDLVEKHLLIECSRAILCMFTDRKEHNSRHKSERACGCAHINKCVQRIANTTIILPIINRIEAANGNLNVEASAKTDGEKNEVQIVFSANSLLVGCLCCVVLCCASVCSSIISHSNLERMKMLCAFRLHDYCGTTQL